MLLINKYRPKTLKEISGQDESILKLKKSVLNKEHCFLYGGNGNGKTSSVYALANDLNYELFELNASDYRTKDVIERILGSVVMQRSLFNNNKIILIDELDGISSSGDRGGIQSIQDIMDKSIFPIVLIANDPWISKFNTLRKKCNLIEFKSLDSTSTINHLKKICDLEKIKYNETDIKILSNKVKGDLRAAINDLQTLIKDNKLYNVNLLESREPKEEIMNLLRLILKNNDLRKINQALLNTNVDLDELSLWLDENIPREYMNSELEEAYYFLSKSNIFKSRIINRQYWRFLVYQSLLMSCGVALAKKESKQGFVNYKRTGKILKIWINNAKQSKRKAILESFLPDLHMSNKKFLKELVYMKNIFSNQDILTSLNIKTDESKYLII